MADRFKYAEIRQKIIEAIRTDLIGPRAEEEVLTENRAMVTLSECSMCRAMTRIIPARESRKSTLIWPMRMAKTIPLDRMMTMNRYHQLIFSFRPLSESVSMFKPICRVSAWMSAGATM